MSFKTGHTFDVIVMLPQIGQGAAYIRADPQLRRLFDALEVTRKNLKILIITTFWTNKKTCSLP